MWCLAILIVLVLYYVLGKYGYLPGVCASPTRIHLIDPEMKTTRVLEATCRRPPLNSQLYSGVDFLANVYASSGNGRVAMALDRDVNIDRYKNTLYLMYM
jgi:hypothetical protein